MSFQCYICHDEKPSDFVNSHHKVPKSLGGSDGPDNRLELCSGCHQDLHVLARMMRNPKRVGEVRTALQSMFPQGSVQARCMELATLIIKSQVTLAESAAGDTDREIGVGLKLKKPYRDALQVIARDRGLSMSKYVRKIVEKHILDKYPNVENITQ